MLHALIWDVDGTLAETERDGHREAFNEAMREHGVARRWSVTQYGELLSVSGGLERLLADMKNEAGNGQWPGSLDEAARLRLAQSIHGRKSEIYRGLLAKGGIAIRPGVMRLMQACHEAGLVQAITSPSGRNNVDALLRRMFDSNWPDRFGAVVCGEDAPRKKPSPEIYQEALTRLQCSSQDVLVIEDSPNGLAAAQAAGLFTIVTPSAYFKQTDFETAPLICDDLDHMPTQFGRAQTVLTVETMRTLHRRWHHV